MDKVFPKLWRVSHQRHFGGFVSGGRQAASADRSRLPVHRGWSLHGSGILQGAPFAPSGWLLIETNWSFPCMQLEKFGLLRAWKAGDLFGILLETDMHHLTQLGLSFMQNTLSLEDGMEVLRIQSEWCSSFYFSLTTFLNLSIILLLHELIKL